MAESRQQTSGAKQALNKAEDAVGAAVGLTSATILGAHSAHAFAQNAVVANLYEIQAARLALQRSGSERTRALARQMIDEHERLGKRMAAALAACGLEVDHKLDNRRQGMMDNLRDAPDDQFDRRYLEQQAAAHREAITLFNSYAENGDRPALSRLARETVPILEDHLQRVRSAGGH